MSSSESRPPAVRANSRTEDTERAYLSRALWFEAHAARNLAAERPSPLQVAAYALERRPEWAKSTWRQIKSALIFRYASMGTPEAQLAVDALRDGHQGVCATNTRNTSARRAKTVSPASLDAVIAGIRASRSIYAPVLESWLLLGAELGLRPHEWVKARVVWASPLELGDVEQADIAEAIGKAEVPYLRVANGKTTNGRSHGEYRHLNLARLDPTMVQVIDEFAQALADIAAQGKYAAYYSGCRKLLTRINSSLHAGKTTRWVQLYSPRHIFSSEAKRLLDREGVAALLGHGTTKTAGEHYGRRSGSSGSLGPRPVAAEVVRVRRIRSGQARRMNQAAPGSTPSPGDAEPS